ncbi:peptide chain release factor H [Paractinoplanes abujensis]|uniref:Peptide chain release factor n=1 Tax=Paractinoplanes abujensis TaxID=882441 RepID=A0A7W7G6C5_9ACTN|nr:peptide chain release factor-like protein [Actinoplanes abujensis]MBB4697882.1 peptide chain release factor [Actinoplanes abujensis]GID19634.1 peptide chain release factor H [Actinoplanes abujensis]
MSVHLLLSAGRGPRECDWALAELVRRLETEAAGLGLTIAKTARQRSVVVEIDGPGAASFARGWTGTLCWQAPSPFRTGIGRKNWYVVSQPCSTEVPRTTFDEGDVEVVATRTGGPGGQHRNKASTAVRATHRPSGLVVVVDTERQFSVNRRLAMRLLRERLASGDAAAEREAITARWRVHDTLVRGNPTRTERPATEANARAGTRRPRRARGR